MSRNLHCLAAEIARRVPAMALDCAVNNERVLLGLLQEGLNNEETKAQSGHLSPALSPIPNGGEGVNKEGTKEQKGDVGLDQWLAERVMHERPRQVAMAFDEDETGISLYENDEVTRSAVEKFCRDHPQWHFKVVNEYPNYTADTTAALKVLEKCHLRAQQMGQGDVTYSIRIVAWNDSVSVTLANDVMMSNQHTVSVDGLDSLPLAICLFARKFFGDGVNNEGAKTQG